MADHLKFSDVKAMFTADGDRKIVLSEEASKRVSDMLGLDAAGEVHLIVKKAGEPEKVAVAADREDEVSGYGSMPPSGAPESGQPS